MKAIIILVAVFLSLSFSSIAQISRGGFPKSYKKEISGLFNDTLDSKQKDAGMKMHTTKIDVEAKKEKEKADVAKSDCKTCTIPYYGKEIPLSFDFFDKAKSKKLKDGGELWLLKLDTKDWHGFQFFFEKFYLPEGSELFFYNEKKDMELGAFTSQNNREDGQFITQPLLGDKVYIEYYKPSEVKEQAILKLGAVVCIFDDSFLRRGPFSSQISPTCNVNTSCPAAYDWQDEVKSVGMILEKNSNNYYGICTGALLNKSANYLSTDKPIFLSANHCYETFDQTTNTYTHSNTANWVFMFRHEGALCTDDGSSIPNSLTNSVTGATVLQNDLHSRTSDYLLLQLNCTIDDISKYSISFAGWSRNEPDGYTDKSVAIHHPRGDIKKFTYTTAVPETATNNYNGNTYVGGVNAIWKVVMNYGVTDNGSSGCPLFNKQHQIIGQLWSGENSCTLYWLPEYYGKFSTSFTYGNFQNYLGGSLNAYCYTPPKPNLDLKIASNPTGVSPNSDATFTASASNNFGNLTCWWVVNTEQGDLNVQCNANTDAYCYSSNTNPSQSFHFNSAGNYRITLWAIDQEGKQGSKDFTLVVGNSDSNNISVDFFNTVCKSKRVFPLGAKAGFSDYTIPKYSQYKVKEIDYYYDNNLKEQYIFTGGANEYVGTRSCFSLNSVGQHFIKIKAYAAQVQANGSYTKLEPPATVTKEIFVVDCNGTSDIASQTLLNAKNGFIADGTVLLNPTSGSSIVVNSGGKLNIDTYNKAILKPGVKFVAGSACVIKSYTCPSVECDCSAWTKSAKINNPIVESNNQDGLDKEINIYPNPVNSYTIIDLGEKYKETEKIELFDASGKLILNQDCDFQPTNYVNTNDFIHGLYFVKVTTISGQVIKKMVKN